MTYTHWLFVLIGSAQLLAFLTLLYRSVAKHVLDPMGLASRMDKAEARMLVIESRYVALVTAQTNTERSLFDRLDDMRETHSKMLGHMTALEARVDSEAKERREITLRLDQITAALANVASRFGGIETALRVALDARPGGA